MLLTAPPRSHPPYVDEDQLTASGWPTKPGPLLEAGILGQFGEQCSVPDCVKCKCLGRGCAGYKPLSPSNAAAPCKTYTSYDEYLDAQATQSNDKDPAN